MQIQEKFDWSTNAGLENLEEEGLSWSFQHFWLQLHTTRSAFFAIFQVILIQFPKIKVHYSNLQMPF